jgi:hypothetical protein
LPPQWRDPRISLLPVFARHSGAAPPQVVILAQPESPYWPLPLPLLLLLPLFVLRCHPERSFSQSYREKRSRRTPIPLAPPRPLAPFSHKSPAPACSLFVIPQRSGEICFCSRRCSFTAVACSRRCPSPEGHAFTRAINRPPFYVLASSIAPAIEDAKNNSLKKNSKSPCQVPRSQKIPLTPAPSTTSPIKKLGMVVSLHPV